MTRLRLDYQRRTKPFPVAGAVLLSVSLVAAAAVGDYYHRLTLRIADWSASLKKFEQAWGGPVRSKHHEVPEGLRDIKQANEVLRQITLPWESLFHDVEASTSAEVTLLGMEPDAEKHTVIISCEAKNIVAMLDFIKRLKERGQFGSVYLLSHQIQEHDPQKPVRFSLIASWRIAR